MRKIILAIIYIIVGISSNIGGIFFLFSNENSVEMGVKAIIVAMGETLISAALILGGLMMAFYGIEYLGSRFLQWFKSHWS